MLNVSHPWRRARFALLAAPALALLAATVPAAAQVALAPYKDKLFGYRHVLESSADGRFMVVDYDERRDIDDRDSVPEHRVRGAYVSLAVRRHERQAAIDLGDRTVAIDETGEEEGARFAVVFVHGRGGDRRLGANDWMFGGNFNRMKNLAVNNGGVYVAPSVPSFDARGAADIAALVAHLSRRVRPGAPIVLACASMGSFICWRLAHDARTVGRLKGIVVMGGATDPTFLRSAAFRKRLPIYLSHGSRDAVYPFEPQRAFFRTIAQADRMYPERMVLFPTGSHGTPVRMTDWRDALNWIFAQ